MTAQERHERAVEWWNDRIDSIIRPDIDAAADQELSAFKWGQLVWQEVVMFIQLGRVGDGDIDWLVERRGFNDVQAKFLRDILQAIRLVGAG